MASQAEVPRTVGEGDLQDFLEPISKQLPGSDISLPSMVAFFKESYPGLEFDPVPTYLGVFSELRGLPPDEQEKLLVGFYSQNAEVLPNGAELGRYLARINNISWFKPKSPPDEELLERLRHQALSRLNLPDFPLRIIKEDWVAAEAAYQTAIGNEIHARLDWGALVDADGDPTRGEVSDAAFSKAWRALMDATTLRDVVERANKALQSAIQARAVTDDAASAAKILSAISYSALHPEDPDRDAAFSAANEATVARTAAFEEAHKAASAAVNPVLDATKDAITLDPVHESARYKITLNAGLPAAVNAIRGADWIAVKNKMPHKGYDKGNPFKSLMEICELGCWPVEIVPDQNGKKEFVIFIPH